MNAGVSWLIAPLRIRRFPRKRSSRREPRVKSHVITKGMELRGGRTTMSVNRKRFRVEQSILGGAPMEMPMGAEIDAGPMHREIMNELRGIRAQMADPVRFTAEAVQEAPKREVAQTQPMLET